ncbi:unnamed protein product [Rotaria socialis]|uniref:Uncharacterized protein n=1 Tax=Rotaria socialis TaxID=392032 RepID=A0A821LQG8_9BILA|nr:unnamed protein product [Rotaria socialis]CAF4754789.1 unnamed protein product [Rotaria socialis]
MSIEKNDEDLFTLVWLGDSCGETQFGMKKFINKFTNLNALKEYIIDKPNSSIIVIISDSIPFDGTSFVDSPQICAVYNEKLVCLYSLSEMFSTADKYLKNQQEETKKTSDQSCISKILSIARKYWFLVGLAFSICMAYIFPNLGKTGGYIRSEWTVKYGCVILVFFLSGLSLRTRQLAKEILHIRLHILIQIYSLIVIPVLVYYLTLFLSNTSMNKTLLFGMIIMASTSTTISSNVIMTKNALGNEYAALLNAILGNILGIFLSPAMILFFMKNPMFDYLSNTNNEKQKLDYGHVIKNLTLTVLLPLFIGQIIHLLWAKKIMDIREKFHFSELSSLALLTLVWSVFCTCFSTGSFKTIGTQDLIILMLIDLVIYLFFSSFIFIITRLPIPYWQFSEKDSIAIMFCSASKTLAMGISVINALYGNTNQALTGLLSLPLIMYHAEQLIIGAIQVVLLKNWIKNKLKDNTNIQSTNENEVKTDELEIINVEP